MELINAFKGKKRDFITYCTTLLLVLTKVTKLEDSTNHSPNFFFIFFIIEYLVFLNIHTERRENVF